MLGFRDYQLGSSPAAGRTPGRPDLHLVPGHRRGRAPRRRIDREGDAAHPHRRRRDHPPRDQRRPVGPARPPRSARRAAPPTRPAAHRGGGAAALGVAGQEHGPHRDPRRGRPRPGAARRRPADPVLPVGQPRRSRVRRAPTSSTSTATPTPTWPSGSAPTSAWARPWPASSCGPCSARCCAACRTSSWWTRVPGLPAVQLRQRPGVDAGALHAQPARGEMTDTASGPLSGVRVVELGVWVAGPGAGGILADWGADVIKVEPPEGDPARTFGKMLGGDLDINPVFELDNRGKRSMVLDLSTRAGLDLLHELLSQADVFLTNIRVAALERLGLGPDHVPASPRLVYAMLTGYGVEGPDADRAAYDIAAFWARCRHRRSPAGPGRAPALPAGRHGRPLGRHDRRRHGQRRPVRARAHRPGPAGVDLAAAPRRLHHRLRRQRHPLVGPVPERRGARDDVQPVVNNYTAGDGRPFWIVGLEGDRHWPALARAVGRPEWLTDARFATATAPGHQRPRADRPAGRDLRHPTRSTNGPRHSRPSPSCSGARSTPLRTCIADEQFLAAKAVVDVPDEQSSMPMLATPADFDGEPPRPRFRAPQSGSTPARSWPS